MRKTAIILLLLTCTGCANSGFTMNAQISPSNEYYDNPHDYMEHGFALTDQITENAVDNLMGMP